MSHFLQFPIILLLFVCIRAGDLAISAGIARDVIRCLLYGVVSLLALIALVLALVARWRKR